MNRRCRKCGAPAPDSASVFCNKCGAQLPAEEPVFPVCARCGRTQTDYQSRFCDRCGAPIRVARPAAPPAPVPQTQYCRKCGAVNTGEILLFCRKCGTPLGKAETRTWGGGGMPPDRPAPKAAGVPAAPPRPVSRMPEARTMVPELRRESPGRTIRSKRMIIIGIIAAIIIGIAAYIILGNPGILSGSPENSSESGLPGSLSLPGIGENSMTSPGTTPAQQAASSGAGKTGVSNQGTPVFSDSEVNPWAIK